MTWKLTRNGRHWVISLSHINVLQGRVIAKVSVGLGNLCVVN
jgi:hypothetical protein